MMFAEEIRARYGVTIPFHHGTLEGARRQAQDDVEYLVVYLHCPTHEDTAAFVKTVLGDDEVIAHLSQGALLCGVSVMEDEGWRLSQELGVTTFPSVVVLFKKTVVMRLQGPYNKEEFLHEWETCVGMWGGAVAEEISYRHEREIREQRRVQEETAVSEMERADIERLEQIQAELREKRAAAARAEALKEEQERRRQEEEARERELAEQREREEARRQAEELERKKMTAHLADSARERLPAEPPAQADPSQVALISIRSLQGKQHQRRFNRSDLVDSVLDFAMSVEEEYDGSPLLLVTGFPPKPLAWTAGQTRIAEMAMLCPRAVVIVRKA